MGLSARIDGRTVAAGNRRLMDTLGIALGQEGEAALDRLLSNGQTPILVARDGQLIGMLGMSDMAREGAAEAITRLRNIGIGRVVMLTGDQHGAAEAIAREVGPKGVHVAYLVIDAVIDVPWTRERWKDAPDDFFIAPDDIAAEVFHLAHQPKSAWSFLSEVRPFRETW